MADFTVQKYKILSPLQESVEFPPEVPKTNVVVSHNKVTLRLDREPLKKFGFALRNWRAIAMLAEAIFHLPFHSGSKKYLGMLNKASKPT